jgi:hypothetical protein
MMREINFGENDEEMHSIGKTYILAAAVAGAVDAAGG